MKTAISNSLLESLMDAWFAQAIFNPSLKLGEFICKELKIVDDALHQATSLEDVLDIIGKKYLV